MKFPFVLRSQYDDAMKVIDGLNERLDKVHGCHRETVRKIETEQREWNQRQMELVAEMKLRVSHLDAAEKTAIEARKWASDVTAENHKINQLLKEATVRADNDYKKYQRSIVAMQELDAKYRTVSRLAASLKREINRLREKPKSARRKKPLAKKKIAAKAKSKPRKRSGSVAG